MGFRILGASTESSLVSLQGDITLAMTPDSGLTFSTFGPVADPPRLTEFDNFIDTYGPAHATNFSAEWQNYDGDRVHRFLADYTGDTATYMPASRSIRDDYWAYATTESGYRPAAHLMYPLGLYYDAVEDGFPTGAGVGGVGTVQEAYANWLDEWNFSYSASNTAHYGQVYSRPVAYCLLTAVMGQRLAGYANFNSLLGYSGNYPLNDRYATMLGKAQNHLKQWRTNNYSSPSNRAFIKPFMVGLTCYALAQYYELNGNANWDTNPWGGASYWPDIPTAVEDMLSWMYLEAPNHQVGDLLLQTDYEGAGSYDTFPLGDRDFDGGSGTGSSPELNMLIAPAYAWLGKHYSDSTYVTNMADRLFAGMVDMQSDGGGKWYAENTSKQYNQMFVWAQEYFTWRQQV